MSSVNIPANYKSLLGLYDTQKAIGLIKSTGKPPVSAFPDIRDRGSRRAVDRMLRLLTPIYDAYQERLASNDEIDFEDMLNMAADHVREGRFRSPYRWIVVDS